MKYIGVARFVTAGRDRASAPMETPSEVGQWAEQMMKKDACIHKVDCYTHYGTFERTFAPLKFTPTSLGTAKTGEDTPTE